MYKVLVEEIDGNQDLRSYEDFVDFQGPVIWDERKDGPMPSVDPSHICGLVRSGDQLIHDASKKALYVSNKDAEKVAEDAAATNRYKEDLKKILGM